MAFNMSAIKTSSDGLWQGENPLHYAFPLLIIQTILVIFTSRVVAFFLKPLRQPTVVAEIVGGIILGPSALGRNKHITSWIFPSWSTPILESVASVGLLFFLFLVGLELDLNSIRRSGKRAIGIASAGVSLPFVFGIGLTFLLRKALKSPDQTPRGPNILFIGIALSITAFPVLARILAELKLLTTAVGETAMAAAALNDVVAWILLALAVAMAGGAKGSAVTSIWILLSGLGFVAFMIVIVRPGMRRLILKFWSRNDAVGGSCVLLTLTGVMISGLMTDLLGIHSIFGAFVFGLIIPKNGGFARELRTKTEDFVSGLLLPLYFASNGLKTDVAKIQGGEAWGILAVVISTACAGKILGTFVVALMCTIPVRESLVLGVLMNTKGLVELIVLNIGRDKKVLNDEMFTILVMMALFTTFITTPIVMAIYKPHRNLSSLDHVNKAKLSSTLDLRVLACIRGPGELPSLITLVNSAKTSITKLYIMHLIELTDRSSSINMVQRTRKNGFPCVGRFCQGEFNEQISASFEVYHKQGQVKARPTTSISKLSTMHEDICHIAEKKRAEMIILPFHKHWKREDDQVIEINLGQGWRGVNERVLRNAKCSIGVLIDRGFGLGVETGPVPGPSNRDDSTKRVCVVLLGGPDSREALQLGGRMANHSGIRVTVIRFRISVGAEGEIQASSQVTDWQKVYREEQERDETTILDFIRRWDSVVSYVEKESNNIVKELLAIAQSTEFELIIVGKGKFPRAMTAEMANHQVDYEELGPIGGLLASSRHGITSSILVIQQHDSPHEGHNPRLKGFGGEEVL
ncbi:hypothetical protein BUALT_Bualt11G0118700 [Buddleja alternifolia]|uniref:Cation/H+ exchanger domain-containing protein n=1 Tax=Buddleja alternifolia TaxID=168488 RepID=A0AAV6WVQ7_9LAMI|nr:hypothetical protein BUALT_Bualt11G0118700 [Buddleja alternifolia]